MNFDIKEFDRNMAECHRLSSEINQLVAEIEALDDEFESLLEPHISSDNNACAATKETSDTSLTIAYTDPGYAAVANVNFVQFATSVATEMREYRPAFLQDGFIGDVEGGPDGIEIIEACFETIRPKGTYSINVICESGRHAYGVRCDNAGHRDWQLFDNVDDALIYADLMADV